MGKKNYRYLEPIIEDVLREYGIEPYEPAIAWPNRTRHMLPQDIAKAIGERLNKRIVTELEEIYQLLLADPHMTEATNRDEQGVYVVGADGSKRHITELEMEAD